ncbi:MAG: hypothetical protein KDI75_02495 [Xanthomonadales bacterium]|nr:hypothetical protein [Xanthomonadales bacterium]
MKAGSYWMMAMAALLPGTMPGAQAADGDGQVVVQVETLPPVSDRTVTFEGRPGGTLTLAGGGRGSLGVEASEGTLTSTMSSIDPRLTAAGYKLVQIRCDDLDSANVSTGDLGARRASFAVDRGESVTCTFLLEMRDDDDRGPGDSSQTDGGDGEPGGSNPPDGSNPPGGEEAPACTCPKEGRWRVNNHVGSMICSGPFSMNLPLAADSDTGRLIVNSDCSKVHADSMGDDEADIDMLLQPDCSWKGSVGGERDGIPMTIHFRWSVESETRITGDLYSTVSQQGMTCNMKRTYELDFEG